MTADKEKIRVRYKDLIVERVLGSSGYRVRTDL